MAKPTTKSLLRQAKTRDSLTAAYAYGVVLIILVLCQLANFTGFKELIASFGIPGGELIASLICIFEVLSLPFLFRINLSTVVNFVSMIFCLAVPLVWLSLAAWLSFNFSPVLNIGFLGTLVSLMPGWWAVFVSLALEILAIWASWGLWPAKKVE